MPEPEPLRTVSTITTESVRFIARPCGRERRNPPSLDDLRQFVTACDGLPGDLTVRIEQSRLDEAGRHTTTFSVVMQTPVET